MTDTQEIFEIPSNTLLAKNFPESARRLLHTSPDYSTKKPESDIYELVKLKPKELVIVKEWVDQARQSAVSLGITPRAIDINNIRFIIGTFDEDGNICGGFMDFENDGITLELPKGMDVAHPNVETTFYHEASHFFSRKKLNLSNSAQDPMIYPQQFGFDRSFQAGLGKDIKRWGFWEESLAVLFSAYAGGHDSATYYFNEISFMVAFMVDYSRKAGREDVFEAFREIYSSNSQADFSFFKRLGDLYSEHPNFVKFLNRIRIDWVFSTPEDLKAAAQSGGFENDYETLRKNDSLELGEIKIHNAHKKKA